MTNLEKYEDQIKPYAYAFKYWGVINGKIENCEKAICDKCELDKTQHNCTNAKLKWLQEEYKEPKIDWTKVAVDTPILVSNDNVFWWKRYFAKYEDEQVFTWGNGATSWSGTNYMNTWKYVKLAEKEE